MKYLHDREVVHGDLKPRNVLVDLEAESGAMKAKVADFGLTETKKRIELVSQRSRQCEILQWKAPERFAELLGPDSDDPFTEITCSDPDDEMECCGDFLKSKLALADVYSFGLTCSYILGGKVMFPHLSLIQLRKQRMQGFKPKLPSACPDYLKSMIYSCLESELSSRPSFYDICATIIGGGLHLPHPQGQMIEGKAVVQYVEQQESREASSSGTETSSNISVAHGPIIQAVSRHSPLDMEVKSYEDNELPSLDESDESQTNLTKSPRGQRRPRGFENETQSGAQTPPPRVGVRITQGLIKSSGHTRILAPSVLQKTAPGAGMQTQGAFKSWQHTRIPASVLQKNDPGNDRTNQELLRRCLYMMKQIPNLQQAGVTNQNEAAHDSFDQPGPPRVQRRCRGGSGIASMGPMHTGHEDAAMSHMMAERRRRVKQKENFIVLRRLLPIISKRDKASTLSNAVIYLKDLQEQVMKLEASRIEVQSRFESLQVSYKDLEESRNETQRQLESLQESYKDLKQQKDELGEAAMWDSGGEVDMTQFFDEVGVIKSDMEKVKQLLEKVKAANEESRTVHRAQAMKALRSRMDADIAQVTKLAKSMKAKLEVLDKANAASRRVRGCEEGSPTDRTRTSITSTLRKRLKDVMGEFQVLRQRMIEEYKETVERRYYTVTGEHADDETIENIIETFNSGTFLQKAIQEQGRGQVLDTIKEIQERHDAVKEIERNLIELNQIFMDMATLVEAQGEQLNDIASHVNKATSFVARGTTQLKAAKDHQRTPGSGCA